MRIRLAVAHALFLGQRPSCLKSLQKLLRRKGTVKGSSTHRFAAAKSLVVRNGDDAPAKGVPVGTNRSSLICPWNDRFQQLSNSKLISPVEQRSLSTHRGVGGFRPHHVTFVGVNK